jgi:hypothetical protein
MEEIFPSGKFGVHRIAWCCIPEIKIAIDTAVEVSGPSNTLSKVSRLFKV